MRRFLLIFFIIGISLGAYATDLSGRIGKIDLSLAVSLHPQMSLFDFDRMGFFKAAPGLKEAEFARVINDLRLSANTASILEERKRIEKEIADLEQKRALLSAELSGADQQKGESISAAVMEIAETQAALSAKIADLNYQLECPELTSPEETRKLLDQIEQEVLAAVTQVADQKNFALVLNTSIPFSNGYPLNYKSGPMFGQGVPGINVHLFYSFLASSRAEDKLHEVPPSRNLINWLELTSFPGAVNLLPIRPWPIVLSGGTSILTDVVKLIYTNHKLSPEIYQIIDSVIHKIEKENELPEK